MPVPRALALAMVVACVPLSVHAQQKGTPLIAEKTAGMERMDGFVPLYWDSGNGKLWLEVDRFGDEFLYVSSLPQGLGSNDIGLDRGQLGGEHVVRFERVGPRVLLVEPNYRFRAISTNPDERRAVNEAFAKSILWGFEVAAETDGRVLVDATDFVLRDVHGVTRTLQRTRQGTFRLDKTRSVLDLGHTKAFPQNSEMEVVLTFTGDNPGSWVRGIAPSPNALTVHQRHSFIVLPDHGYTPRRADPRSGFFGISFLDYAVPIREPLTQRFASRHRLQKQFPDSVVSPPVQPIVYYVDRGAPEPIRSALLEGARWWNQAFEAAGFRDAFRVEILPEGADAMDVRYNVIQWVHRITRGWSYGSSVSDPRTGEIIKGHVSLGSLRVRQDFLIAEGLLSPYEHGDEAPPELEQMALARIRQLAAHEVGHTLGLQHNYIASTENRASVMDYPHPIATLRADGTIDLSNAYAVGIGEWDKVAIEWGYRDLSNQNDPGAVLNQILADARQRGVTLLTDQDARPSGSAHPDVHLWDNGQDVVTELGRMMEVRRVGLDRFGERSIRNGMPMASMEEVLVPLYLFHRYQVEAVTKLVGGSRYSYALRGDEQPTPRAVPGAAQRRALDAALATLAPSVLAFPPSVLSQLPPRPPGFPRDRELFERETGLMFDPVTPAGAAADLVLGFLLHPERGARLVIQQASDPTLPGLGDVMRRIVDVTFDPKTGSRYEEELARTVERSVVEQFIRLAESGGMPQVRAMASFQVAQLRERLGQRLQDGSEMEQAHRMMLVADMSRFLERAYEQADVLNPRAAPPGSPIGTKGDPERPGATGQP